MDRGVHVLEDVSAEELEGRFLEGCEVSGASVGIAFGPELSDGATGEIGEARVAAGVGDAVESGDGGVGQPRIAAVHREARLVNETRFDGEAHVLEAVDA